jgi:hypothetical protein
MHAWVQKMSAAGLVAAACLVACPSAKAQDDPEVKLDPGQTDAAAAAGSPGGMAGVSSSRFTPSRSLVVQDPRPFATPRVPGYPSHPPGARYRWPGGLFYRSDSGHHWRRPPLPSGYFAFERIAPRTQCLP